MFYSGSLPSVSAERRTELTGVIVISSYKRTLDLALSLNPQVNQVFVISGTLERDKRYEVMAREELREFEGRVQINNLTDLSPDELVAKTEVCRSDPLSSSPFSRRMITRVSSWSR